MKIYRVYMGFNMGPNQVQIMSNDKMKREIADLFSTYFDGFTILDADGYWKRTHENSAVVEIFTDDKQAVYAVAELYKKKFIQEAVAVVELEANINFI